MREVAPPNRRNIILISTAAVVGMGMGGVSTCSTTTLDPTTIANAIKIACGILVPAATITTIINATVGATATMIVSLVCSSYKNAAAAQAANGKLAAGTDINFVVHVCDATGASCKDIPVTAKAQ